MAPFRMATPVLGSVPRFCAGKMLLSLKSPPRIAVVGRFRKPDPLGKVTLRNTSSLTKKNDLFFPSYTFGIHTGPPIVPPKSCLRLRGLVEGTLEVKYGRYAFSASLVR